MISVPFSIIRHCRKSHAHPTMIINRFKQYHEELLLAISLIINQVNIYNGLLHWMTLHSTIIIETIAHLSM